MLDNSLALRFTAVAVTMALTLVTPLGGSAAAAYQVWDGFSTLNTAVWHVTNSQDPNEQYRCPGSVTGGCLPANVATAHGNLAITVPTIPLHSGGQIVSVRTLGYGVYNTRLAAGTSMHALNAMFLYSFSSQDEIDVEVTYDGVDHEACGTQVASHRWEVWFTVWRGGNCVSHAEFPVHHATSFHEYGINWRADALSFSLDGATLWTAPSSLTTTDMHLLFNSYEPTWKNPQNQRSPASHMRADWVRVTD